MPSEIRLTSRAGATDLALRCRLEETRISPALHSYPPRSPRDCVLKFLLRRRLSSLSNYGCLQVNLAPPSDTNSYKDRQASAGLGAQRPPLIKVAYLINSPGITDN